MFGFERVRLLGPECWPDVVCVLFGYVALPEAFVILLPPEDLLLPEE